MIVKMKRLTLLCVKSQRRELLKDLMLLGSVELSEQGDPKEVFPTLTAVDSTELAKDRANQAEITAALKLLDKYAPAKKGLLSPLPDAELNALLDESSIDEDLKIAGRITEYEEQIRRASAEESRERAVIETLSPWLELEMPLSCHGTVRTNVTLCSFPATQDMSEAELALGAAAPEAQILVVSQDKSLVYAVLICLKEEQDAAMEALRPLGFSVMSVQETEKTAKEGTQDANAHLAALAKEKEECAAAIAAEAPNRAELQLRADTLGTKIARAEAEAKLLQTESTVCLVGWVEEEKEPELAKILAKYDCAWETRPPEEEEIPDVPVKLKNNRFSRALNVVTEMYSLPAYDGVDPNPLMAPFFIFFYGMMLADMGYGLLMIIAAIVVLKKKKPKVGTRNFMELVLWCGISTFIWGAITGGFFGDFLTQLVQLINPDTTWTGLPYLFTPLNDTVMILIGSMCLGGVHVITGMAISFVEKCKHGDVVGAILGEGTWWVIFAGAALAIFGIGNIAGVPVVLVIGCVMLVIDSGRGKKGFGKITGVFSAVYNGVTGYFGDILSYSRLMALMLAGSVIAQVFNTIGATFGSIIVFLIVSLVGNALNFALNLLGCFVHDLRLQCLEYFNKFYKDGGRAFKPLAVNTKYCNVTTSDN